jgi:uncharacterized protein DUF1572
VTPSTATDDFRAACLADLRRLFRMYKDLGEKALAQTPDAQLNTAIDAESNSIAVTVKHIGGNLRSRFRDFLTSDGEKPDRKRDTEFEQPTPVSRDEVMRWWNEGWGELTSALDALTPADLEHTIKIRDEAFLVVEALHRSVTHTAYHVGQIVYLARHFAGPAWRSLSIPKGQSEQLLTKGAFKSGTVPRVT